MVRFLKRALLATLIVVLVLLCIQPENLAALSETIQFHIKFWDLWQIYSTPPFPVALLFGVFFLLGLLTAGLHGIYERLARRAEIRRKNRRIRELEAEVEALKARLAELKPPEEAPPPAEAPSAGAGSQAPARPPEKRPAGPPPPMEEEPTL